MITEEMYQSVVEMFDGQCVCYPLTLEHYKEFINSCVDEIITEDDKTNDFTQMLKIANTLMTINVLRFPNKIAAIAKNIQDLLIDTTLRKQLEDQYGY